MNTFSRAWDGNWRARLVGRIQEFGFENAAEFLASIPGIPYPEAANRLGNDVASFQLEWLHFEKGTNENTIRLLAMDSLPRDLSSHLKHGWRGGTKGDFDTSGAYADWTVRIGQCNEDFEAKAKLVWGELEKLQPRIGWLPAGPTDPLVVEAFRRGWPSQ